jgi:sugar lactone lactonase YvrE
VGVASSGTNWYVADSGGNDVLRVYGTGRVRTIAVLPRQPFTFTRRVVTGLGMPSCVVGARYQAEPAPTDVEVGPDGTLWVTTLPQLYDLGQLGSLYRVDPRTGRARRFATGFEGATNVAVTASGKIFVAERLSGRIAAVRASGRWSTHLTLPGVLGVEAVGEVLYASVAAPVSMGVRTGPGRIVRIG